jgi:hypothetical protein
MREENNIKIDPKDKAWTAFNRLKTEFNGWLSRTQQSVDRFPQKAVKFLTS